MLVDTGMGRVGVFCRQAVGLIADLAGRKGVSIVGAMTTLNEDAEFEKLQLQRFREVEETLAASGIASGTRLRASPCSTIRRRTWTWCGPAWRSSVSTRCLGSETWDGWIYGPP